MLFASAWVIKHKEGVYSILVCETTSICRSTREVIVEFAYHCYSGSGNDLAVGVVKFDPQVVCSPQPFSQGDLVLKSCQTILDQMNTSKDVIIFAQRNIHSEVETAIPYYYADPSEGNTELLDNPP